LSGPGTLGHARAVQAQVVAQLDRRCAVEQLVEPELGFQLDALVRRADVLWRAHVALLVRLQDTSDDLQLHVPFRM
jgi:hypothetical protein